MPPPPEDSPRVEICKSQIHIRETAPGFYSNTTFQFHDPETGLKWLANITIENAKLLRKIYCSVPAIYNPGYFTEFQPNKLPNGPQWCEFIKKLATEASNLEEVTFYLDSEPDQNHWGPAVDINFVRALGCLRRLEIRGYFPKEWPAYLEGRLGLKVWEEARQDPGYLHHLKRFQALLKDIRIDG